MIGLTLRCITDVSRWLELGCEVLGQGKENLLFCLLLIQIVSRVVRKESRLSKVMPRYLIGVDHGIV